MGGIPATLARAAPISLNGCGNAEDQQSSCCRKVLILIWSSREKPLLWGHCQQLPFLQKTIQERPISQLPKGCNTDSGQQQAFRMFEETWEGAAGTAMLGALIRLHTFLRTWEAVYGRSTQERGREPVSTWLWLTVQAQKARTGLANCLGFERTCLM